MLIRKIEDKLRAWKDDPAHKPLIVKGPRQCGKTYSVRDFARKNYAHVVYLNFYEHPEYNSIFSGSLDTDTIVMMITAFLGKKAIFVPGKTVLILDEIQECPEARTALKFLREDGRYDVIGTGSLLGVKGYGKEPRSIPAGSETSLEMHPLDFEEFLWAMGIGETHIALLRQCLENESQVPLALHQRMRELLLLYVAIGGMPEAVQSFLDHNSMDKVLAIQRDIIASYHDDMVKHAEGKDKARISECFLSIPNQLSKENKKFQYSIVKKGAKSSEYEGCLQWIEEADIVARCYNLSITELPLEGNKEKDTFKVYMHDTGLLIAMLEDGTQSDVLRGNLLGYKGAIYENLVAETLLKMDRKLYYFRKDSGLELDFLIRYKGCATPLEVKASSGNAKSLKTVLEQPDKYHVAQAIKLGDYNVGRSGKILTLPHYMAFLLNER